MLKLNKKVEYALMAILHMDRKGMCSAGQIAEDLQISASMVGKILPHLHKSGLLEAAQGKGGGYRLAVPLDQMNLKEVMDSVEGPVGLTTCLEEGKTCEKVSFCNIRTPMMDMQSRLNDFVSKIRLSALQSPELVKS